MRRRPKRKSEEREAKCSSMCGIKTMCTGRINMAPEHGSLPLVGVHLQDWSLRMSWRQRLCLRSAQVCCILFGDTGKIQSFFSPLLFLSNVCFFLVAGKKGEEVSPTVDFRSPDLVVPVGTDPVAAAFQHVTGTVWRFICCPGSSHYWQGVGVDTGYSALRCSRTLASMLSSLAPKRARTSRSPRTDQSSRAAVNEACLLMGGVNLGSTARSWWVCFFLNFCDSSCFDVFFFFWQASSDPLEERGPAVVISPSGAPSSQRPWARTPSPKK